jgi:hypothetical protein
MAMRIRPVFLGLLCVTAVTAAVAAPKGEVPRFRLGPPKKAPAPKSKIKPSVVKLPPNAPPVISLSSKREWEVALARFLTALQTNRRARAVAFFSQKVSVTEKKAFLNRRWLVRDPTARREFDQILFLPDIQIRTTRIVPNPNRATSVVCAVVPRKRVPKQPGKLTGYYEVALRKEKPGWRVVLHPRRLARR